MIKPNWQVSNKIQAFTTTREGGVSKPPFDGFNLASHVEDDFNDVIKNRQILDEKLEFSTSPLWLNQQHTTTLIEWKGEEFAELPVADSVWTMQTSLPICVMTADCQPILITNQSETFVSAIHAGWKGLLDGIITKSIVQLPDKPENLKVWIGPSISQDNFEVELELVKKFTDKNPKNAQFFNRQSSIKYQADLVGISVQELRELGVQDITKSNLCTYADSQRLYSYRKHKKTGRMATLIWMR